MVILVALSSIKIKCLNKKQESKTLIAFNAWLNIAFNEHIMSIMRFYTSELV